MFLSTNMCAVRLIMSSSCMMSCRSLLTSFIHSEHGSTMCTVGNFSWFNVNLYFLTGSLVLIIIHSITNICSKFTLCIFSGFCSRSTKGPSIPKSCAYVARGGAHVWQRSNGGGGLAGRTARRPLRLCQRIVCTISFHYNKLVGGKYFERF